MNTQNSAMVPSAWSAPAEGETTRTGPTSSQSDSNSANGRPTDSAPLSYAIGDVVTLNGKKGCIVTKADFNQGVVEYAVDLNAWFEYSELTFEHRATAETLAKIQKMIDDEEGDGSDDDEESSTQSSGPQPENANAF